MFKMNGQTIRTGPIYRDFKEGPPYSFPVIVATDDLDKIIQGGEIAIFECWGTSCMTGVLGSTWFQLNTMIFKHVVFQKYEHPHVDDEDYVTAFFTADEIWQVSGTLMEEVPYDKRELGISFFPRTPTFNPANMKKMSWQEERTWKLVKGEWKECCT